MWVLQGGTSSAAFALVQHCGFTRFTLENTGQGAARLGSVTVLSAHQPGRDETSVFLSGKQWQKSCCGKGSEYDAVPSPGDGADAVQEQQRGAPLLSGRQQNGDPFSASARVPPPAQYFKLHTAEGSGRFLVT